MANQHSTTVRKFWQNGREFTIIVKNPSLRILYWFKLCNETIALYLKTVNCCGFHHCTEFLIAKPSDQYLYDIPRAKIQLSRNRSLVEVACGLSYIAIAWPVGKPDFFSFKVTFKLICFKAHYFRDHESLLLDCTSSLNSKLVTLVILPKDVYNLGFHD